MPARNDTTGERLLAPTAPPENAHLRMTVVGLGIMGVAAGMLVLSTGNTSSTAMWATTRVAPSTVHQTQPLHYQHGVGAHTMAGMPRYAHVTPSGPAYDVTSVRAGQQAAASAPLSPLMGMLAAPLLALFGGVMWAMKRAASDSEHTALQQQRDWSIQVPLAPAANKIAMAATVVRGERSEAEQIAMNKLTSYVADRGGNLPIRKVLIANNGMAATKFIHSIQSWAYLELGDEKAIEFVAMASPEDLKANAKFITLADNVVEVPSGSNKNNYANVDLIINIAVEQGVDAVWPGWGHASENPKLPEGLKARGIKFIGPNSRVMAALGDKVAANILAQTANVPCIPWSGDGLQANLNSEGAIPDEIFNSACVTTTEEALEAGERIGYPIMIKASEGGGGKGIRMAANSSDTKAFFEQVQAEVPGSPIFMMQLCSGARHLEVQIVGDEHGNAVALNGRDCSTQRRFQKIFEEGPPNIAPVDTFREMELSALRLTQSIGYSGAGTVEYLFQPSTGTYYFLELNPRLQVEHPVTEDLTSVNLPATQLQVAMGIPLANMPDIRRFYGKEDAYGHGDIRFVEDQYVQPTTHVIAARITAENPDEGFKPTSGSIREVKFRSTPKVWGYFSVGSNGGIHEFADSQFGHLFSRGSNREDARKHLVLALKEMEVRGEIRNPVDYLVKLLETDAFKENTLDTSWLDGLLKERKDDSTEADKEEIVVAAVIYRAFEQAKSVQSDIIENLQKGQLSMSGIPSMNQFPVELSYKGVKYNFEVSRTSADTMKLSINGKDLYAKVRQQPDGSLLTSYGGSMRFVSGMEEPLGLRIVVNGITHQIPNVVDPSELRSDVSGKLVRYLQKDGAQVEKGRPYAEVEAMKMIMSLSTTETGNISHMLTPGSIISPGDQLAGLQLVDPGRAAKILPFEGQLDTIASCPPLDRTPMATLMLVMDGYNNDVEPVVQALVSQTKDPEVLGAQVLQLLEMYLAVETNFQSGSMDDCVLALVKANKDSLEKVIDLSMAHQQLRRRNTLVLSLLRQIWTLNLNQSHAPLRDTLARLASLPSGGYGEVALAAAQIVDASLQMPFADRAAEVEASLKGLDKIEIREWLSVGVDYLCFMFGSKDVAKTALEVYVRKVLYPHNILSLDVSEADDTLSASWTSKLQQVPAAECPVRCGHIQIQPEWKPEGFTAALESAMATLKTQIASVEAQEVPTHDLHIGFKECSALDAAAMLEVVQPAMTAAAAELKEMGVANVHLLFPQAPSQPAYYTFPSDTDYKVSALSTNIRPGVQQLLELQRLQDNYDLEQFPSISRYARVYLGTERSEGPSRRPASQALFLRTVSYSNEISLEYAEKLFLGGLDELQRAMLDPRVSNTASSRMFLNLPTPLELGTEETLDYFNGIMDALLSKNAPRLLKLRVDEIEVKVRIPQEDGSCHLLRLIASSMTGEWLRVDSWREYPDPVTGVTGHFCTLRGEDERVCSLEPYPTSTKMGKKRTAARRVGSTYAHDFLGLFKRELLQQWETFLEETHVVDQPAGTIPAGVFEAQSLVQKDGTVEPVDFDMVGTNTIGMLAWQCTLKTPQYPEGRQIVIIANDVTIQNGSFGVREDEFFEAASEYARRLGLPRIYIACNSGARIGLVEELKPKFKVAFKDAANPGAGYEYLYLSEEDYNELPAHTVEGEMIEANGEKRFKLQDIIGQQHGIGVENLRGSGMIAGETARAYQDAFTLNYVTGRTVGIGAYLVRLGQRVIQNNSSPIILTGHTALNSVLGRDVYTSMDQLGGPSIMHNNGVTHETVNNDQEGVASILKWLAYTPKDKWSTTAVTPTLDPYDRAIEFMPTKTAYDPRHMLGGTYNPDGTWQSGFFDKGSFKEYMANWGKSVVVGRARLGGIPFGCIAVETRMVEQRIPADPANPDSRESILPQAGQVWYPDSAYKTATAIKDFNNGENLPLMIFANWRGFSGGTRDMYGEILKFGAMIVDALVDYKHPVFVYIPPNGELRGGAWVVIDPTINSEVMEMYADYESRGGILEPSGIAAIKFRTPDQMAKMHQLDEQLQEWDAALKTETDPDKQAALKKDIRSRELQLLPLYVQIAQEFADLHDRSGRMKAKGVIRDVLEWKNSREYFYWRCKKRLAQDAIVKTLKATDSSLSHKDAVAAVDEMVGAAGTTDKGFLDFVDNNPDAVAELVKKVKTGAIRRTISDLLSECSVEELQENIAALSDTE